MEDYRSMSNNELHQQRTKLALQISDLESKFRKVQFELTLRDVLMMEREAERSYQAGKKPDDPPTLKEYWAKRTENEWLVQRQDKK